MPRNVIFGYSVREQQHFALMPPPHTIFFCHSSSGMMHCGILDTARTVPTQNVSFNVLSTGEDHVCATSGNGWPPDKRRSSSAACRHRVVSLKKMQSVSYPARDQDRPSIRRLTQQRVVKMGNIVLFPTLPHDPSPCHRLHPNKERTLTNILIYK